MARVKHMAQKDIKKLLLADGARYEDVYSEEEIQDELTRTHDVVRGEKKWKNKQQWKKNKTIKRNGGK